MTENFTPVKAGGQRPRLSKEEYAEKKRAEKDAVYQLADEAAKEIVSSPENSKRSLIHRADLTDIRQSTHF